MYWAIQISRSANSEHCVEQFNNRASRINHGQQARQHRQAQRGQNSDGRQPDHAEGCERTESAMRRPGTAGGHEIVDMDTENAV